MRVLFVFAILSAAAVVAATSHLSAQNAAKAPAAKPTDFQDELPRIPPVDKTKTIETFSVAPGFRVELVAAEPLVHSPVACSFDERGRLYVIEMIDYSEQDKDFLGAVRLLEDTDGDGKFDKSTLFADKLSWPTAVTCYDGGIFVGAPPDLYYLKDTNGDGKADERKLVFTGFNRNNVQGMMNSLHWGLDQRIHGATGTNGGSVRPATPANAKAIELRGRDFAFDPRTLELSATSGGAQHGMSFDDWGRKFCSSNSDHIQFVMFDEHDVARNPFLATPSARLSIAADGPQAEVFRTSPVEPWRIVRTRLRVQGVVKGLVEGGGRAAGYFTGATGVTIYRGNAFPAETRGMAFVGDVGSNLVHRKVLKETDATLSAHRIDENREFVSSKDIWFRPAQFANGPDGCLYICDVYREVIEHPASLPPEIKQHLDLTSGRDRGRIYRVVPEGFRQPARFPFESADVTALVAQLDHPNGWHRDTANRLLFERRDPATAAAVRQAYPNAKTPQGRVHLLAALQGQNSLTAADLLPGLSDSSPRVREFCLKRVSGLLDDAALRTKLLAMTADPDPRVRYQLGFALGDVLTVAARLDKSTTVSTASANAAVPTLGPAQTDVVRALAKLLAQGPEGKWLLLAVQSSVADHAGALLNEIMADAKFRPTPFARQCAATLAQQVGVRGDANEVNGLLQALDRTGTEEKTLVATATKGLIDGLLRSRSPLKSQIGNREGKLGQLLQSAINSARATASDAKKTVIERADAIRSLSLSSWKDEGALLTSLIDNRQPQELQLASLTAMGQFSDLGVAEVVLEAWPSFSPRVRSAAGDLVFSRPSWTFALLKGLESKAIRVTDVDPARLKPLPNHTDKAVKELAIKLAMSWQTRPRQEVLDAYQKSLELTGDRDQGRQIFRKVCAACHKLEGFGHELAPSLAAIQNRGPAAILLNVLDPNREVNPQFVAYVLTTREGRQFNGLISSETATSVTLKKAENEAFTILRGDIDELRSTGLSIMPEGLERQIDPQAMANLLAYLMSVK